MSRRGLRIIRILGAVVLAVVGYQAGQLLWPDIRDQLQSASNAQWMVQYITIVRLMTSVSLALFGVAFGYLLAPLLIRPLELFYDEIREVPPSNLLGGAIGLAVGLLLSALLTIPLSALPDPFGQWLPVLVAVALGYLGVATVGSSPGLYLGLIRSFLGNEAVPTQGDGVLLDTSVIIDGRVADVAETSFLGRHLVVPRFVLNELQQVADSPETLRRNRGRRGLDVLNRLQQSDKVAVEITDTDFPSVTDVDRKLVRLADQLKIPIMTNDFNLNRVAEIQGIRVLNLNELANAVKTLLLPGEQLHVKIIQEGKEFGQGVGYLDDGTMVVVEQGRDHLGEVHPVVVTRVLQTVAGRMIFATLDEVAEPA
jgi:uncharacterized protein YacL